MNKRSIQVRTNWRILFLFLIVTTCCSNVTAFATPKSSILVLTRYRGVCVRSNLIPEPSSNLESITEESEGESQTYHSSKGMSPSDDDDDADDGNVTLGQGIRVGLYRLLLLGSAGAWTGLAVLPLLEGSGLSSTDTIELNMSMGWKFMLGAAAVVAPLPSASKFKSNLPFAALSCVGVLTLLLLLVSIMFQEDSPMESATQVAATMATLGICVREVVFYGAAYKVEAIGLACLLLLQQLVVLPASNNILPGGIALALLVLSFGKLLEPLQEDLRPGQSTFLANNALSTTTSTTQPPLDERPHLAKESENKPPL